MTLFQNLGTCFWPPLVYNLQRDPPLNVNHTMATEARLACLVLWICQAQHCLRAFAPAVPTLRECFLSAIHRAYCLTSYRIPPDVSKSDFLTTLVKISFLYTLHLTLISPQCYSVTGALIRVPLCAVPPGRHWGILFRVYPQAEMAPGSEQTFKVHWGMSFRNRNEPKFNFSFILTTSSSWCVGNNMPLKNLRKATNTNTILRKICLWTKCLNFWGSKDPWSCFLKWKLAAPTFRSHSFKPNCYSDCTRKIFGLLPLITTAVTEGHLWECT